MQPPTTTCWPDADQVLRLHLSCVLLLFRLDVQALSCQGKGPSGIEINFSAEKYAMYDWHAFLHCSWILYMIQTLGSITVQTDRPPSLHHSSLSTSAHLPTTYSLPIHPRQRSDPPAGRQACHGRELGDPEPSAEFGSSVAAGG